MLNPTDTNDSLLSRLLRSQQVSELRALRTELVRDLKANRAEFERLQLDLREVEKAISERTGQDVPPLFQPDTVSRTGMPLRRAIIHILDEAPERVWDRDEVMAELDMRGWAPGGKNPRNTLSTRLAEMANEGQIRRAGEGFTSLRNREVPAM